jgi:hypothetical protein
MAVLLPDFNAFEQPPPQAETFPVASPTLTPGLSSQQAAALADTSSLFPVGDVSLPFQQASGVPSVPPPTGFIPPGPVTPLTPAQAAAHDNPTLPMPELSGFERFLQTLGVEVLGETGNLDEAGRPLLPQSTFGQVVAGIRNTPGPQQWDEFVADFNAEQSAVFDGINNTVGQITGGASIRELSIVVVVGLVAWFGIKLLGVFK